jgi:hypothetical protein
MRLSWEKADRSWRLRHPRAKRGFGVRREARPERPSVQSNGCVKGRDPRFRVSAADHDPAAGHRSDRAHRGIPFRSGFRLSIQTTRRTQMRRHYSRRSSNSAFDWRSRELHWMPCSSTGLSGRRGTDPSVALACLVTTAASTFPLDHDSPLPHSSPSQLLAAAADRALHRRFAPNPVPL